MKIELKWNIMHETIKSDTNTNGEIYYIYKYIYEDIYKYISLITTAFSHLSFDSGCFLRFLLKALIHYSN